MTDSQSLFHVKGKVWHYKLQVSLWSTIIKQAHIIYMQIWTYGHQWLEQAAKALQKKILKNVYNYVLFKSNAEI